MGSAMSTRRLSEADPLPPSTASPDDAADPPLPVGIKLAVQLLKAPEPPILQFDQLIQYPFADGNGMPAAAPLLQDEAEEEQAPPPPPPVPVLTGLAHAMFEAGILYHPFDASQPAIILPQAFRRDGRAVVKNYSFRRLYGLWHRIEVLSRIGLTRDPRPEEEDDLCIFCFVEFRRHKLRLLPCGHLFHSRCLDHYILLGHGEWEGGNVVCPICRAVVGVFFV
ncbi:uncharacterized protein LOC127766260 [Oryza glaberrima]|uniref:uncharacterized protein LOC127766259 n=1 Tax=Oryza glaberrima TaxID=4538 RepID=UPI00224BFDA9|nr:uncharacterized protein LOC127766259 [Oryza glaberrima]XP_052147314.1 uncharacterized protein LOC127766260 [Oryza glaberrima]